MSSVMKEEGCLENRILKHVQRLLEERSIRTAVSPDDELRGAGLASLDMVTLMLLVETEFEVLIPGEDITPANFRSVGTISRLIVKLMDDSQIRSR